MFETVTNAPSIKTVGPVADRTTPTLSHLLAHARTLDISSVFQDFSTQSSAYDGLPYKGLSQCFDLHKWNDHRKTGEDRCV